MYIPTKKTVFVRSFGPTVTFEEINLESLQYIESKVTALNYESNPIHATDLLAYELTLNIISFCKKWLEDKKVKIIIDKKSC
jgi:hypothetical protein